MKSPHTPWRIQKEFPWAFENVRGTPVGECFGTSNNNKRAKENAKLVVWAVNEYFQRLESKSKP